MFKWTQNFIDIASTFNVDQNQIYRFLVWIISKSRIMLLLLLFMIQMSNLKRRTNIYLSCLIPFKLKNVMYVNGPSMGYSLRFLIDSFNFARKRRNKHEKLSTILTIGHGNWPTTSICTNNTMTSNLKYSDECSCG